MSFTTGKLRVLIATTNGPVEVQLLTEEDAAIGRCVACIGGTTETADIAAAYHAFVVRPTGVIEGRYGHSCYRLDVSGRIDAGSSWQLGVLAAHALLAAGRLAQENDAADGILWATGSVRPVDLTVGAVSHVPEKLAKSLDRLKQDRDAGRSVLLAVPAGNAADVSSSTAAKELLGLGVELVTVPHAQALFDVLEMKLPGAPSKAPAQALGVLTAPQNAVAVKPARRTYAWAAAVALIGIVAAGALSLTRVWDSGISWTQSGGSEAQPAPAPAPTPVNQPGPEIKRAELDPETIPFIKARDKERIRDEYMPAPNYKALAMNMFEIAFVSGLPSQEAADKAAVETCENTKRRPPSDSALAQAEYRCDLFASGTAPVTRRANIAMPPMSWINAPVQRPFVSAEIPMASQTSKDTAERRYRPSPRSKALVISPTGRFFMTSGESSPDEAMRRTLERCGYLTNAACLVVAVDNVFVAAVPTLGRAVGFYRPHALFGVQAEERAEVARRLADAAAGWNAVAVGATGHTGTKVGATSERSAVDSAIEDCASRDRDCRIAVIGPFLVEAAPANPAQPAPQ